MLLAADGRSAASPPVFTMGLVGLIRVDGVLFCFGLLVGWFFFLNVAVAREAGLSFSSSFEMLGWQEKSTEIRLEPGG